MFKRRADPRHLKLIELAFSQQQENTSTTTALFAPAIPPCISRAVLELAATDRAMAQQIASHPKLHRYLTAEKEQQKREQQKNGNYLLSQTWDVCEEQSFSVVITVTERKNDDGGALCFSFQLSHPGVVRKIAVSLPHARQFSCRITKEQTVGEIEVPLVCCGEGGNVAVVYLVPSHMCCSSLTETTKAPLFVPAYCLEKKELPSLVVDEVTKRFINFLFSQNSVQSEVANDKLVLAHLDVFRCILRECRIVCASDDDLSQKATEEDDDDDDEEQKQLRLMQSPVRGGFSIASESLRSILFPNASCEKRDVIESRELLKAVNGVLDKAAAIQVSISMPFFSPAIDDDDKQEGEGAKEENQSKTVLQEVFGVRCLFKRKEAYAAEKGTQRPFPVSSTLQLLEQSEAALVELLTTQFVPRKRHRDTIAEIAQCAPCSLAYVSQPSVGGGEEMNTPLPCLQGEELERVVTHTKEAMIDLVLRLSS